MTRAQLGPVPVDCMEWMLVVSAREGLRVEWYDTEAEAREQAVLRLASDWREPGDVIYVARVKAQAEVEP